MTRRPGQPARDAALLLGAVLLALEGLAPEPGDPAVCAHPESMGAGVVRCGSGAGRLTGPARWLFGLRVDANRATPATLEALPGIGPALAEAIAHERARGPFCDGSALERVAGIGPVRAASMAPRLRFGPAAGCPGSP